MKFETYAPEGEQKVKYYTSAEIEKAWQRGSIIEAKAIKCDGECNLYVDLGCMKGVIPKDAAAFSADGEVKNIAVITRVGKSVCFKVTGFAEENGVRIALLSRALAQREAIENYISRLTAGDVVRGRVTHVEKFGAFVDIGCGYVSLLPIDSISVSRINHPSDRFKAGDFIYAVIKAVEEDGLKITLSHRELLGTWEENACEFEIGQTAIGKVRSIENYGIFVELTPNLAGLAEYRPDVKVGQSAGVFIKNIIPERMKVKLVIVDSFDDDEEIKPMRYFINEGHINSWIYTPSNCSKLIESNF